MKEFHEKLTDWLKSALCSQAAGMFVRMRSHEVKQET